MCIKKGGRCCICLLCWRLKAVEFSNDVLSEFLSLFLFNPVLISTLIGFGFSHQVKVPHCLFCSVFELVYLYASYFSFFLHLAHLKKKSVYINFHSMMVVLIGWGAKHGYRNEHA